MNRSKNPNAIQTGEFANFQTRVQNEASNEVLHLGEFRGVVGRQPSRQRDAVSAAELLQFGFFDDHRIARNGGAHLRGLRGAPSPNINLRCMCLPVL